LVIAEYAVTSISGAIRGYSPGIPFLALVGVVVAGIIVVFGDTGQTGFVGAD
jgi:hypothetical protein